MLQVHLLHRYAVTYAACLSLTTATSQGTHRDAFYVGRLLIFWPCHATRLTFQKLQRAHSFCI
jgi:hypothetical protein